MESRLKYLQNRWPSQVAFVAQKKPVIIVSVHGLGTKDKDRLKRELLESLEGDNYNSSLVSVILSTKQGHIYFRIGDKTYDYRPHRGNFSKIAISDYRLPNNDRSEVLLSLNKFELQRLQKYISNIENNRYNVLGDAHPLSLLEPDFTVKVHETKGKLDDNRFIDERYLHNCLTWLTTAPLGNREENVIKLLGIGPIEIQNEVHSYIIKFYQFLLRSVEKTRCPGIVFWTTQRPELIRTNIETSENYLIDFYSR